MARSLYAKLLKRFGTPPSGREKYEFTNARQATVSLQTGNFLAPPLSSENQKSIVIVGAGFAGLSAAYYLTRRGHVVVVLEARNRVGGRVFSDLDQFAKGQIIEFGAELIGSNHPQWVNLAKEFGLSFNVVTGEDMFEGAGLKEPLIIDNKPVSDEEALRLFLNMDAVLKVLTELCSGINWENPWLSADADRLDKTPLSGWFNQQIATMHLGPEDEFLLKSALAADFTNNNVVACDKQSLLAVLAQVKAGGGKLYWTMTEVYRCADGNDALATKMKEAIDGGGRNVIMNMPVEAINVQDDHATVYTKERSYYADYVVMAIPPTVWADINMDPKILELRSQTGVAIKYMSAVTNRFWIKNGVAPSGLCGSLGMTWEGSDNQVELQGKMIDLSCFSGGPFADNIIKMNPAQREIFFDTELERVFKGYNDAVIKRHYQCWPEERWTKTGYSFPGLGEVCTKIRALNQPYKRMFFAGEHTSAGFWGYMEGALRSGMLAAERIHQAVMEAALANAD
ncbi:MAG: FAD-dependent oxidoreductase [Bacteroidota bacterium]|nr:FAD-dependent oxidoreductase [Bacteroidota bacterium]